MSRLQGKVAIVTGGAQGIGKAIAEVFAGEGAIVFIADIDAKAGRQTADEICRASGKAVFVRCDVASAKQVQRVAKLAANETGRIDVLCNNAAFLGQWHGAGDAPVAEWEKCFRVTLMGTQYFTRAVLPFMVRRRSGSIINISSVQGLVGARTSASYTSIKHALLGFTRSVACDYGAHGIRCNAVCPGAIHTRISPKPGSELHKRQLSKTMLGRIGEPREVAQAALFLASDESSYITGVALPVDGGWTAI
jgi:NAD(P)-dependent dehydrogenase (short-subunit alcohol dehydrogenase family)